MVARDCLENKLKTCESMVKEDDLPFAYCTRKDNEQCGYRGRFVTIAANPHNIQAYQCLKTKKGERK